MTTALTIERARVWDIALPLTVPFVISGGAMRVRRSLIVELEARDGSTGFGESAPFELPFYSSETVDSARWMLTTILLPRLIGRPLASPFEADTLLRANVRGNPFARTGAETAVWDLFSHRDGVRLLDVILEALREMSVDERHLIARPRVTCGVALGIPDDVRVDTLARWTREALEHGYGRVKIKIRPGWDVEPIRAVRAAIAESGRSALLWADANASYDLERDADALRSIDDERLLFIEQPLQHDDLVDHATLATRMRTPICLDESLRDARWARHALTLGASKIWNIKVQRLGGLSEALRVYALAAAQDVAVWGGTMPESGIGAHAILALAALPRFVYPSDVEPSERWYSPGTDPLPLIMAADGTMPVPTEHGLATVGVGEAIRERGDLVWTS